MSLMDEDADLNAAMHSLVDGADLMFAFGAEAATFADSTTIAASTTTAVTATQQQQQQQHDHHNQQQQQQQQHHQKQTASVPLAAVPKVVRRGSAGACKQCKSAHRRCVMFEGCTTCSSCAESGLQCSLASSTSVALVAAPSTVALAEPPVTALAASADPAFAANGGVLPSDVADLLRKAVLPHVPVQFIGDHPQFVMAKVDASSPAIVVAANDAMHALLGCNCVNRLAFEFFRLDQARIEEMIAFRQSPRPKSVVSFDMRSEETFVLAHTGLWHRTKTVSKVFIDQQTGHFSPLHVVVEAVSEVPELEPPPPPPPVLTWMIENTHRDC